MIGVTVSYASSAAPQIGVGDDHTLWTRPSETVQEASQVDQVSAELDEVYDLAVSGRRRLFQMPVDTLIWTERGIRTIPISIYLASEANATEVELALVELLDRSEVDIIRTKPPIIDSWFGLMIGRFRRWLSSEETNEIVARVERVLEVRLLDQPQADVDAKQAEAVARLMEALENQPSACIKVGSIFLLKVDGVVVVRNLSPEELSFLRRHHTVMATPHQVLSTFEAFSNGHTSAPRTEADAIDDSTTNRVPET